MATVLAGYLLEARDFSRVRLHVACLSCELGVKNLKKKYLKSVWRSLDYLLRNAYMLVTGGVMNWIRQKNWG